MDRKLSELVQLAQGGDKNALQTLIQRLMPLVKKHGHRNPDDEADLVLWLIGAVLRYKPNTAWDEQELEWYSDQEE